MNTGGHRSVGGDSPHCTIPPLEASVLEQTPCWPCCLCSPSWPQDSSFYDPSPPHCSQSGLSALLGGRVEMQSLWPHSGPQNGNPLRTGVHAVLEKLCSKTPMSLSLEIQSPRLLVTCRMTAAGYPLTQLCAPMGVSPGVTPCGVTASAPNPP